MRRGGYESSGRAAKDLKPPPAGPAPGMKRAERCAHRHVSDEAGYPDHDGRCRVFAVCEDCGENLGQSGWDSVL